MAVREELQFVMGELLVQWVVNEVVYFASRQRCKDVLEFMPGVIGWSRIEELVVAVVEDGHVYLGVRTKPLRSESDLQFVKACLGRGRSTTLTVEELVPGKLNMVEWYEGGGIGAFKEVRG